MDEGSQPAPTESCRTPGAWRGFVAGVFDVTDANGPAGGESLGFRFGRRFAVAAGRAPSLRLTRTLGARAGREIEGVAVHLVGVDRIEGRMGVRSLAATRGDLIFYDLLEGVDLRWRRSASEAGDVMLWTSRPSLPKSLADYVALHGLTVRGGAPAGALIGAAVSALAKLSAAPSERDFDALAEGVLAMIAAAVGPLLDPGRAGPALASFVTIRRHIDKNLHAPSLNAGTLAATFGLSRASLYRLFEPVGGIAEYIRAARLQRAYGEIVDSEFADRRIGPIAYGLGFKNIAAFNRAFRHRFGASPRELRAGVSVEFGSGEAAGDDGEFALRNWLARARAAARAP